MVVSTLKSLLEVAGKFWQDGILWAVYLAALAYLVSRRKSREKDILLWTVLIYALAIFNPVTFYVLTHYILNAGVTVRLFWGVPYAITIAYCVADAVRQYAHKLWVKMVSICLAIVVIIGCGKLVFVRNQFDWNTNKYGLPQVAVDMLEILRERRETTLTDAEREEVRVAFPEYICSYVLQYDTGFRVLYGRDGVGAVAVAGEGAKTIFHELSSLTPDYDVLVQEMDNFEIDFFATYFTVPESELINRGCEYLGEFYSDHNGNYKLFQNRRHPESTAVITMYPDTSGAQGMFYTIEEKGRLVVVDGGHAEDADMIRWIAGQHGNKIDAWIITHGHVDHVGAANEILADPGDITIGHIYTIDFDLDLYHELAREWDEPVYYDRFYELLGTMDSDKVTFLHAGDKFNIGELTYEVFSAYDENTQNYHVDICNRGSLFFKVSGAENSMLFTSDVAPAGTNYEDIIAKYEGSLKADYLQMAHHGNNTCPKEFIELVSPSVAFFDSPGWFFDDESYQSAEARGWVEAAGGSVVSYDDAPYRVLIR